MVNENGWMINEETGEIVACPGSPDPSEMVESDVLGRYVLTDAAAERIMESRHAVEADMAALVARRRAINANLDAMERRLCQRLGWIDSQHGAQLEDWVRDHIAGRRERSVRTPYGVAGLRKTAARVIVEDEAEALDWADRNAPEAVRVTRRLLVSALPKDVELPGGAFRTEPAAERFYVKGLAQQEASDGAE